MVNLLGLIELSYIAVQLRLKADISLSISQCLKALNTLDTIKFKANFNTRGFASGNLIEELYDQLVKVQKFYELSIQEGNLTQEKKLSILNEATRIALQTV